MLDHDSCLRLLDLWLEADAAMEALRRHPLGRHLRRVPVPSLLSESTAALWCAEILGEPATAVRGVGGHDLRVEVEHGTLDVEAKGSVSGWITITRTDRRAAAVIWLDFSRLLHDRATDVVARVYPGSTVASLPDRVVLDRAPEPLRTIRILPAVPPSRRLAASPPPPPGSYVDAPNLAANIPGIGDALPI